MSLHLFVFNLYKNYYPIVKIKTKWRIRTKICKILGHDWDNIFCLNFFKYPFYTFYLTFFILLLI